MNYSQKDQFACVLTNEGFSYLEDKCSKICCVTCGEPLKACNISSLRYQVECSKNPLHTCGYVLNIPESNIEPPKVKNVSNKPDIYLSYNLDQASSFACVLGADVPNYEEDPEGIITWSILESFSDDKDAKKVFDLIFHTKKDYFAPVILEKMCNKLDYYIEALVAAWRLSC